MRTTTPAPNGASFPSLIPARTRPGGLSLAILPLLAIVVGCPPQTTNQTNNPPAQSANNSSSGASSSGIDGNVGVDPASFPGQHVQGEPDDTFSQAIEVIFDSSGHGQLQGTIAQVGDIDVYSLGALHAGDRIIIDVGHNGGNLDSTAAVFDSAGDIAFENDDRNPDLNQLDPLINDVIRHDSSVYYLAIAASPFADPGTDTGPYDINVTRTSGGTAPAPQPQALVLNFGGGSITIPGGASYTVGPFNSGEISPSYAGLTQAVEDQILATVQKDYTGLALNITVSPPAAIPTDCSASVVLFGGHNPTAFGTSQDVDPYNTNHCDQSIIFTDMFGPNTFGRVLSATQLGEAIGNVTAHEIGHLLGLNHVDNTNDIMDTTGGPNTFFVQQFTTSPLDSTIFPIGSQDGPQLLLETLGSLANP